MAVQVLKTLSQPGSALPKPLIDRVTEGSVKYFQSLRFDKSKWSSTGSHFCQSELLGIVKTPSTVDGGVPFVPNNNEGHGVCLAIASQTHWPSLLFVESPRARCKYGGHGKFRRHLCQYFLPHKFDHF